MCDKHGFNGPAFLWQKYCQNHFGHKNSLKIHTTLISLITVQVRLFIHTRLFFLVCLSSCTVIEDYEYIDHIQQWKMQEIWNPFHGENYLFSKGFSNFERTTSKICLFFKCSLVMHETVVKRISFSRKFLLLYEVYFYDKLKIPALFPLFTRKKVRKILMCCRNCSQGIYYYFDFPIASLLSRIT